MEMIIQEGMTGTILENITDWEIAKLEVTGTFVVKVFYEGKILGVTPFNPKTTVLIFNYDGHFDDEPISTNGKRA